MQVCPKCATSVTRWTSRSWRQAWATWWETSALGSTTETRALLMPSLKSEKSPLFSDVIDQRLTKEKTIITMFVQVRWAGRCHAECSGEVDQGGRWHQALLSSCWWRLSGGSNLLMQKNTLVGVNYYDDSAIKCFILKIYTANLYCFFLSNEMTHKITPLK